MIGWGGRWNEWARHAFTIQSQLLLVLIRKFKLDVSNIHYDISSVELYGDYGRQLKAIEAAQNDVQAADDAAADDSDEATDTSDSSAIDSKQQPGTERRQHGPLPMYGSAETMASLQHKFRYVFDDTMRPMPGTLKPEGQTFLIEPGVPIVIGDVVVHPFTVPHGRFTVTAYRIGPVGYVTDAKSMPEDALAVLRGVKVLVLNALFRTTHPTHLSIPEAIAVAREIGAERTYLTHLTHDNFHADLEAELPAGIAPAFDGLTVRVE